MGILCREKEINHFMQLSKLRSCQAQGSAILVGLGNLERNLLHVVVVVPFSLEVLACERALWVQKIHGLPVGKGHISLEEYDVALDLNYDTHSTLQCV